MNKERPCFSQKRPFFLMRFLCLYDNCVLETEMAFFAVVSFCLFSLQKKSKPTTFMIPSHYPFRWRLRRCLTVFKLFNLPVFPTQTCVLTATNIPRCIVIISYTIRWQISDIKRQLSRNSFWLMIKPRGSERTPLSENPNAQGKVKALLIRVLGFFLHRTLWKASVSSG